MDYGKSEASFQKILEISNKQLESRFFLWYRNRMILLCRSLLLSFLMFMQVSAASPSSSPLKKTAVIPVKILIKKAARELILIKKEKIFKTYKVALGTNPVGHKQCEGDGKTPEGNYVINYKNKKSKFHLSLQISYPNKADCAHAKKKKCSPGGFIMIHGLPKYFAYLGSKHLLYDWTLGCIAVTNTEIEEIWKHVSVGTPVEIVP